LIKMNIPTTTITNRITPRTAQSPISAPFMLDLTGAWVEELDWEDWDEETVPVPVPVGEEVVPVAVELEAAA
jgi:hypothetical protein